MTRAFLGRWLWLVVWLLVSDAVFPPEAAAYLDPGSGSYLFQVLMGIVLGVGCSIKRVRDAVTGGLRRLVFRRRAADDDHG